MSGKRDWSCDCNCRNPLTCKSLGRVVCRVRSVFQVQHAPSKRNLPKIIILPKPPETPRSPKTSRSPWTPTYVLRSSRPSKEETPLETKESEKLEQPNPLMWPEPPRKLKLRRDTPRPSDYREALIPHKPLELHRPSKSSETPDCYKPQDPPRISETSRVPDPSKPQDPPRISETRGVLEPSKPQEPPRLSESREVSEPSEPQELPMPSDTREVSEPSEPQELPMPSDTREVSEPSEPQEPSRPSDTRESQETSTPQKPPRSSGTREVSEPSQQQELCRESDSHETSELHKSSVSQKQSKSEDLLVSEKVKPLETTNYAHPPGDEESTGRLPSSNPGPLRVGKVDVCLQQNGLEHHTYRYEMMTRQMDPHLVVRRGQPFQLNVVLNRDYQSTKDAITFVFEIAESIKPSYSHGTSVVVPLLTEKPENGEQWTAVTQKPSGKVLSVSITSPARCIVGAWSMDIDTKRLDTNEALSYRNKPKVYILFNPWCPDDQVYIDEEEKREEYVEMDIGWIWQGSSRNLMSVPWAFYQFEKDVLECSIYLMTKVRKVPLLSCSDPVIVSRTLAEAMNAENDNGVIVGNWSGNYSGGVDPQKWVGSLMILQRYYQTKKPVRFGQCWVYAGVLTTVCRALGLPARTVTNYAAAVDTGGGYTVDYYFNDKGDTLPNLSHDMVWNYHVWVEVWMKRPDLQPGDYDGWNYINGSPQGISNGKVQCGPASVKAVKRGENRKTYDTEHVYSLVNSDEVYWKYSGPHAPLKLISKNSSMIGQCISTKAVAKWAREDITDNYKFKEGSEKERSLFMKVLKQGGEMHGRYNLNEPFDDINFKFNPINDVNIGSPFSFVVVVENLGKEKDYQVAVILRVDSVLYTGQLKYNVCRETFNFDVSKNSCEEAKIDVNFQEYYPKMDPSGAFKVSCMAKVHDTNFDFYQHDYFTIQRPQLNIKIDGVPVNGREFRGSAFFFNPLPVTLKRGRVIIEGPSLRSPLKFKLERNISPNSEMRVNFKGFPMLVGGTEITAKFYSDDLSDVNGFLQFMVKNNSYIGTNP